MASGEARIIIDEPDGRSITKRIALSELDAAASPLPDVELDGRMTASAADVLTAGVVRVPIAHGSELVLAREGRRLTRVSTSLDLQDYDLPDVSVEWNETLDTVWVDGPAGSTTISLEGVPQQTAAELIGQTSVLLLGAHIGVTDAEATQPKVFPVVIALATLGIVGYVSCIWFGNTTCLQAAVASCGQGNVASYKNICGGGYDVQGKFQAGYNCSILCK